jgi:ABC-type glycerol-3-phosphate transport system substrate-binding protein
MKTTHINRRNFLHLAAAGAAGAALAACTSQQPTPAPAPAEAEAKPTSPPAPAESVEIDFWWGWTPDVHVNAINAAVAKFMEANPTIKVVTAQHEWGEKLLTALAAGTPPALFEQNTPTEYAAKGSLVELDSYLDASSAISRDTFYDVSLKEASYKGKVYGVPALEHFAQMSICVNKKMAEDAGLSLPADLPKSMEDLMDQCYQYSEIDKSGNLTKLWYNIDTYFPWYGAAYGLAAYDEEAQKFNFGDQIWIEVLNLMGKYYQFFGADKLTAFDSTYPGWTAVPGCGMCSDVQAIKLDGYWTPGEFAKTAPDKEYVYSWYPVPKNRQAKKVQMIGSHHVMIPNAGKHHEAAWKLAEYLTSNEAIRIIFEGAGFLLATKAFLKDPNSVVDVSAYKGLEFYIDSVGQADEIWGWPAIPIENFVWDQWTKAYNAVGYKEKSAEQAAADLQAACTEELSKALSG